MIIKSSAKKEKEKEKRGKVRKKEGKGRKKEEKGRKRKKKSTVGGAELVVKCRKEKAEDAVVEEKRRFRSAQLFLEGNLQCFATDFESVKTLNGSVRVLFRQDVDETEASGVARLKVLHDLCGADCAIRAEERVQCLLGNVKRQVVHKQANTLELRSAVIVVIVVVAAVSRIRVRGADALCPCW